MKNVNMTLTCPNCSTPINLDEALISQFSDSIRKDLESEFSKSKKELQAQQRKLVLEKEKLQEFVDTQVRAALRMREEALKESIKKEVNEEKSKQLEELEKELIEKSRQLKDTYQAKAQLERLRREIEEREIKIIAEKEIEMNERLEEVRQNAFKEIHMKLKEREKIIQDLKNQLDLIQQKVEQGSMQLQGEIGEITVLELLQEFHPTDDISQTKKGTAGADVLQVVKTENGAVAGSLYYEIKRTKAWQHKWVQKLKENNLEQKADILILVTNVLPAGMQRYGIYEGIWICHFSHVKELSLVLRYGILKLQQVAIQQHGKETKMELLYQYLTSQDFKDTFEAIVSGFVAMRDMHHAEKLKLQRIWREKEILLDKTLKNTISLYGSVKGIAGSSIPEIPILDYKNSDTP